jgi:hypothetical protein
MFVIVVMAILKWGNIVQIVINNVNSVSIFNENRRFVTSVSYIVTCANSTIQAQNCFAKIVTPRAAIVAKNTYYRVRFV